jgi:alpha-D-xyloside xylohydrolase
VTVYPGADGAFEMFEDDGKSFEYRRGGWMGIAFTWTDRDRRLAMSLAPGSRMRAPLVRDVVVRVAGQPSQQSVKFSGRPVSVKL